MPRVGVVRESNGGREMSEMYWITRLDGVRDILVIFAAISLIILTVSFVSAVIGIAEKDRFFRRSGKSLAICGLIIAGIANLGLAFIPTTKEALLIYGVGGGIDYIKSDTIAQQLPHKFVEACDAYLDEILKEDGNE